jgi:hypothetical protein
MWTLNSGIYAPALFFFFFFSFLRVAWGGKDKEEDYSPTVFRTISASKSPVWLRAAYLVAAPRDVSSIT